MRKPPPYHEAGEPLEPSELENLREVCECTTRVEILLVLGTGSLSVGELAAALKYSVPHVSNHLRVLRGARLATCEHNKKRRVYAATANSVLQHQPSGFLLVLAADDGSEISLRLPLDSAAYRRLSAELRERLERARRLSLARAAEVHVPAGGVPIPSRPSSAPESPAAGPRGPSPSQ